MGRGQKVVPITASEVVQKKKNRKIVVRVVDIFGNDAGVVVEV